MRENVGAAGALLCHNLSAVLTHADAVAATGDRKGKAAVVGEIKFGRAEGKKRTQFFTCDLHTADRHILDPAAAVFLGFADPFAAITGEVCLRMGGENRVAEIDGAAVMVVLKFGTSFSVSGLDTETRYGRAEPQTSALDSVCPPDEE